MPFQIFSKKEYSLINAHSASESKLMLSKQVMEIQNLTIDFISGFADKQMGLYQYFEGDIQDSTFKISHKRYFLGGQQFRPVIPLIKGTIVDSREGSTIHIISDAPTTKYVWTLILPIIIFFTFVLHGSVLFILVSSIVYFLGLFVNYLIYSRRSRKDKNKLKEIFEATEVIDF